DGFVIEQRTDLSDIDGTPDGRATQRLVVTPHPGQAIWLDFVEALDLGDGYSLSFHYTGETVDTAYPLLEIYATGDWTDVASATGADVHPMASGEGALRAIPTVSRTLTRLELALPADRNSSVDVYDIRGRRVAILPIAAGERSVGWDGADDDGRPVASGVYLARHLDASGAPHTARIVRLR
ncbi:MAG: hypothetical protein KC591_17465, partial [Gemmatimonadetes bacterium]|nr:hypothetical protein [Gemmatimonadota bacterium]